MSCFFVSRTEYCAETDDVIGRPPRYQLSNGSCTTLCSTYHRLIPISNIPFTCMLQCGKHRQSALQTTHLFLTQRHQTQAPHRRDGHEWKNSATSILSLLLQSLRHGSGGSPLGSRARRGRDDPAGGCAEESVG